MINDRMTKSKKILLIDDNPRDVELVLEALRHNNLKESTTVLNRSTDVLDFLLCRGKYQNRKEPLPELIITDLGMPGMMSGVEVIKAIRSNKKLYKIPVIVLTGSSKPVLTKQLKTLSIELILFKSFAYEDFMTMVKTIGEYWKKIVD